MTKKSFRIAAMAVLVNDRNQVLIGSSPRDGGFKFPQGGLEPNEDAITGIKRELNEELGIIVTDNDILLFDNEQVEYLYPAKDPYYIYKGQRLSVIKIQYNSSMQLIPQDDEFDELHWIQPVELKNFDVGFRLKAYQRALQICDLL